MRFGTSSAALRVLIMAGQHGDEGEAREALEAFCQQYDPEANRVIQLAIITNLNPDGAARHTRYNACGIDLNLDHQRLASVETRTLEAVLKLLG